MLRVSALSRVFLPYKILQFVNFMTNSLYFIKKQGHVKIKTTARCIGAFFGCWEDCWELVWKDVGSNRYSIIDIE